MKLTRRGFFGGIIASAVAACLPKVAPAPLSVVEEPPLGLKWSQLVYGTPIVYCPRKFIVLMKENT